MLEARLTAIGETQAYFDVAGICLALNVGESDASPHASYDHVAFTIEPADLVLMRERLHAPLALDWSEYRGPANKSTERSKYWVTHQMELVLRETEANTRRIRPT